MAEASVAETLAYFDGQQPGRTAGGQNEPGDGARADGSRPPQETTEPSTATAEPNIEAASVVTTAETATVGESPAEDGLDTLVESATGVALGALAVTVEDTEPARATASSHSGPLDSGAATPGVSANELPDGFALEVPVRMPTQDSESPEEPVFQPYSQLTPRRQVPLAYPRRAAETAVGSIVVEFIVTETGEVTDVSVRGDVPPLFLREAVRTVRQWRFEPVEKNGQLVPVRTALRVTYRG
jgi:TonB family protein